MVHFNKKAVFVFALLNTFSLFGFADRTDLLDEIAGIKKETNYEWSVTTGNSKKGSNLEWSATGTSKKDGTLEWSVVSSQCSQNNSFKCIGFYDKQSSKILGNQMNPFADELNKAGFTMIKINPQNGEQNSIIKCNALFTQKKVQDSASLANCVEYTKASCQRWNKYVNSNAAEFRNVNAKVVDECTAVMKSIDKINVNLRNIFQGEIKQSEKDITNIFHAAAHPSGVSIEMDTSFSQDKLSSHISTYKAMFDRTEDCNKYSEFFSKNYLGTKGKDLSLLWLTAPSEKSNGSRDSSRTSNGKTQR